jgi:hypothetical protein
MTFGDEGTVGARIHDLKAVEAIVEAFQAHGHNELVRFYNRLYVFRQQTKFLNFIKGYGHNLRQWVFGEISWPDRMATAWTQRGHKDLSHGLYFSLPGGSKEVYLSATRFSTDGSSRHVLPA